MSGEVTIATPPQDTDSHRFTRSAAASGRSGQRTHDGLHRWRVQCARGATLAHQLGGEAHAWSRAVGASCSPGLTIAPRKHRHATGCRAVRRGRSADRCAEVSRRAVHIETRRGRTPTFRVGPCRVLTEGAHRRMTTARRRTERRRDLSLPCSVSEEGVLRRSRTVNGSPRDRGRRSAAHAGGADVRTPGNPHGPHAGRRRDHSLRRGRGHRRGHRRRGRVCTRRGWWH